MSSDKQNVKLRKFNEVCEKLGHKLKSSSYIKSRSLYAEPGVVFNSIISKQLPIVEAIFGSKIYGDNPQDLLNLMRISNLMGTNAANILNTSENILEDIKENNLWVLDIQSLLLMPKILCKLVSSNLSPFYEMENLRLPNLENSIQFIENDDNYSTKSVISIGLSNDYIIKNTKLWNIFRNKNIFMDYSVVDEDIRNSSYLSWSHWYRFYPQIRAMYRIVNFAAVQNSYTDDVINDLEHPLPILNLDHNSIANSTFKMDKESYNLFVQDILLDANAYNNSHNNIKLIKTILTDVNFYTKMIQAINILLNDYNRIINSLNYDNVVKKCFKNACMDKDNGFCAKFLVGLYYFSINIELIFFKYHVLDIISKFALSMMQLFAISLKRSKNNIENYINHPTIKYYEHIVSMSSFLQFNAVYKFLKSDLYKLLEKIYNLAHENLNYSNSSIRYNSKYLSFTKHLTCASFISCIIEHVSEFNTDNLNKECKFIYNLLKNKFIVYSLECLELIKELSIENNEEELENMLELNKYINKNDLSIIDIILKTKYNNITIHDLIWLYDATISKFSQFAINYTTKKLERYLDDTNLNVDIDPSYLAERDRALANFISIVVNNNCSLLLNKILIEAWTFRRIHVFIKPGEFNPIHKVFWLSDELCEENVINPNDIFYSKPSEYFSQNYDNCVLQCFEFVKNKQLQSIQILENMLCGSNIYTKLIKDEMNYEFKIID